MVLHICFVEAAMLINACDFTFENDTNSFGNDLFLFEHYNMLLCGNDMFLLENGLLLLEDYTCPHGDDMFLLGTYSESVRVCENKTSHGTYSV